MTATLRPRAALFGGWEGRDLPLALVNGLTPHASTSVDLAAIVEAART